MRALVSISPNRFFKCTAPTLPAKPPSADAWPAATAWVLVSRCQRSSRRSLRASRVNEIAKHFAKFVRG